MRKHKINLLKSFLISSSIVGTVLPICFANYHNSVLNNDIIFFVKYQQKNRRRIKFCISFVKVSKGC